MGLPAPIWFVIAVVALLIGGLLLLVERLRLTGTSRDRKQWAALRDWEFIDEDPVLPGRWRYGTIHQGGPGVAKNLVSGWLRSHTGNRRIYVFDHEQHGTITSVIVGVETSAQLPVAMELRLAQSARPPDDVGLEGHGPIGKRIAFVSDVTAAQPIITPRLAATADAVGDDVELIWAEGNWVLAAAPVGSDPNRLQDLLLDLVEVATALERARDPLSPQSPSGASTETTSSTDSPETGSASTTSPASYSPRPAASEPTSDAASSEDAASDAASSEDALSEPRPSPSPSPREPGRPEGRDFQPRES